MTKEQEELQKKHARFKDLHESRRAKNLTESEERELVTLSIELEERSINALVEQALKGAHDTRDEDLAREFLETAQRAYRDQTIIDFDTRATTTTSSVAPVRPSVIQEILEPLQAELIHTKVGLKMQTGVTGQPVWPILAGVEATIAGEDTELVDQALSFSNLNAKSERIGVTVPITAQALSANNTALRSIVIDSLGKALGSLINKTLFSKTAPSAPHNGLGSVLAGPYAAPLASGWSNSVAPTFKEVTALVGEVLGENVVFDNSAAYFVHPKTHSLLSSTPVEKGDAKMILSDDRINGYPVISTTWMAEDAILFGVLVYAVHCQHGSGDRFYVQYNPKKDRVEFTVNGDYSNTVLRTEAFAAIKRK